MGGSRSQSEFFWGGNRPKIALKPVLISWSSVPCVFCLYTLLKVVGYYDVSVLSMSVMGFQQQQKFGWGWVGVSPIQFFFSIFGIF